ncbi:hypothetical protein GA0070216_11747 [Micromonospora matsumotoense]|uniref:Uncharacterized protein n=1 Tax=Micromonospora matsumotoense TaxID=121616 RepID=A0A1C5AGU7_9ACTN|nr:hypothetical protein [Micromonospora matsumotoense]SCF44447.1 hypothetical protein GA0070216_11747 [Micromonospora matsumotoense]
MTTDTPATDGEETVPPGDGRQDTHVAEEKSPPDTGGAAPQTSAEQPGVDRPAPPDPPAPGRGDALGRMDQLRAAGGKPTPGDSGGKDESWRHADDPPRGDAGPDPVFSNVGQTAYGDHAVLVNIQLPDGRRVTILRSQRTPAELRESENTSVTVDGFDDAVQRLKDKHVVVLRGGVGTGRRTTAELMLWRVVGIDRVVGVEDPEVTLTQLARQEGLLLKGHGTVLELPASEAVTIGTLRAFESLARNVAAYVVILDGHGDTADPTLARYTVDHTPPPPENVLRRHLLRLLRRQQRCTGGCAPCVGDCWAAFVERCVSHDRIAAELSAHPRPRQTVELAQSLASWSGIDEELEAALGGLRRRRRDLVARLLKQDSAEKTLEDPQAAPRRQAFQIAYAALHNLPLADVFDASELLLGILQAVESGTERLPRVVFDGGVDQMLHAWGGESPLAAAETGEQPRRARLADPRLLFDVLDVVWHDFDGVRLPLLVWLEELVFTRRDEVRRRAAQITGWLATYDFDEVCNGMLRQWAADERGTGRQAAAWALDVAAYDDRLVGRIQGRVLGWVRSANPLLHDTAARVYSTRIGRLAPTDTLRELRTLASRDDLNGSASVARALMDLYPVAPEETWRTLVAWNGDDLHRLRVHAARGMTLLGRLAGRAPHDGWPLLLTAVECFTPEPGELAGLWQGALGDPTTAPRAWKLLHAWLQLGDEEPVLADRMVALFSEVLVGRLVGRSRFYLRDWSRQSATARRLLTPPGNAAGNGADVPSQPTPGGNP